MPAAEAVAEPGPVIARIRLLAARIWALRSNLTTYGAAYVAAAEQYGCALVTTGALMTRATGTQCPVNLIS
jgi:predicted nucleic acid-binding protein